MTRPNGRILLSLALLLAATAGVAQESAQSELKLDLLPNEAWCVSGGQETRESDVWSRRGRRAASFSATSGLILAARYWT